MSKIHEAAFDANISTPTQTFGFTFYYRRRNRLPNQLTVLPVLFRRVGPRAGVRQATFRTDRSSPDIVVLSLWLRRLRAPTRRSLHGSVDRNSRAGTKQWTSTVSACGS